jgi:hypothetical protein
MESDVEHALGHQGEAVQAIAGFGEVLGSSTNTTRVGVSVR